MTNNQNNALVDLGIGCLNTNGLGNKHKRNLVLNWLKRKSEGIISIQESHSTQNTERESGNKPGEGKLYSIMELQTPQVLLYFSAKIL